VGLCQLQLVIALRIAIDSEISVVAGHHGIVSDVKVEVVQIGQVIGNEVNNVVIARSL